MPIDFPCSQCGNILRVADEFAGRHAKCPACGSVVVVPLTPPSPAELPEVANPFAAPRYGADVSYRTSDEAGPRTGPPWERDGASIASFVATAKEIFNATKQCFQNMRREGGFGMPLLFTMIGSSLGVLAVLSYQMMLPALMVGAGAGGRVDVVEFIFGSAIGAVAALVILPVLVAAGTFFAALINHLMLMLVGGANYPFETTFRVVAYTSGATSLLNIIPLCGNQVSGIVQLVFVIIGLAAAHEISGGKAAAAVLLPFAICCGLVFVVIFAILA